jgi:hypothetical protein
MINSETHIFNYMLSCFYFLHNFFSVHIIIVIMHIIYTFLYPFSNTHPGCWILLLSYVQYIKYIYMIFKYSIVHDDSLKGQKNLFLECNNSDCIFVWGILFE